MCNFQVGDRVAILGDISDRILTPELVDGVTGTIVELEKGLWVRVAWDIPVDMGYTSNGATNCWGVLWHEVVLVDDKFVSKSAIERKISRMWNRQTFVRGLQHEGSK